MSDSIAGIIATAVAIAGVGLLGCGDPSDTSPQGQPSLTSAAESGQQASDSSGGAASEGGAGSGGAGSGDVTGDSGGETNAFVMQPDVPGASECDIWTQDCPAGEKCMPWANDGGSSWNATRCSPVARNPDQPGDTCSVEGNDVSGEDSCGIAAMCWSVDPETNEGTCFPFCQGTSDSPLCDDPESLCSITNDGVLALCLPMCNPLLQDCDDGQGCYPLNGDFGCMPDYSYRSGAYGEPCEFINVCDPGLFCANPNLVPRCVSGGCCSEYCTVGEAETTCQGAADGQECVPWYAEGEATPGLEDVGICGIPN